jgi:hypothetical protein
LSQFDFGKKGDYIDAIYPLGAILLKFVACTRYLQGDETMAESGGKNDKGKKEQKKKPKLTIKEKRKVKQEKKHPSSMI